MMFILKKYESPLIRIRKTNSPHRIISNKNTSFPFPSPTFEELDETPKDENNKKYAIITTKIMTRIVIFGKYDAFV